MLPRTGWTFTAHRMAPPGYMRAAAVGGAPDVDFLPEQIEVSAEVDACFVVGTV